MAPSRPNPYANQEKQAPPSLEERNRIVEDHLPLVHFVATRLAGRLPNHVERDDLVNSGVIGLIDAVEKFDPGRQIKFKTYAEFRVKGAMLDELRRQDWLPRSTRQKATRLEKAYHTLEQELGRPPGEEEVMDYLELDADKFYALLAEAGGLQLLSLDEVQKQEDQEHDRNLLEFLADPEAVDPAEALNLDQVYQLVADGIDQLPKKEGLVLSLYYNEELTMKEIGEILSVTESRVCQLHTQAILRLRGRLQKIIAF